MSILIYYNTMNGSVEGVVNNRIATLISIFIYPKYRNQGYGTELLKYFLHQSFINGAVHIELDDCSANYRKANNIYLKYGFKYRDNDNYMIGNVRNIISNLY